MVLIISLFVISLIISYLVVWKIHSLLKEKNPKIWERIGPEIFFKKSPDQSLYFFKIICAIPSEINYTPLLNLILTARYLLIFQVILFILFMYLKIRNQ